MVDPKAGTFITSLVKSLQMLCHGYMEFNDNIEIIGHINLRIDNSLKFDYIVNEQVSKQGGESTYFQSNSYHSLPPTRCTRGERERQHSGRFEDEGSLNNHHRMDESVSAAFGGGRVQVDLSGPMPVTRSTSAPSPDTFFSTASGGRRRSHNRNSHLHSVEEEQAQPLLTPDHSFNHSSLGGKDRGNGGELTNNGGGTDSMRTDISNVLALFRDKERPRQHGAAQRQDIIVKSEPSNMEATMDETGEGPSGGSDALDATSVSSMLPVAHQSGVAAHTGHAMLAATSLGHPSFFDTSLTQQEVTEGHPAESPYHHVTSGNSSGQDLSKQNSQNGVAMSLVTRNRTPPDLGYPTGPTQLPQTADVSGSGGGGSGSSGGGGGKEGAAGSSEKNRCDHCSKYFRTAELLSMHIALIHRQRNYMSPKALRTSTSPYSSVLTSPSSQGASRRASQSPSHQGGGGGGSGGGGSSSLRSKSQSPISIMQHSYSQPLALTYSLPSMHPGSSSSPATSAMGMSLPPMASSSSSSLSSPSEMAAMAAAALAQSYSLDSQGGVGVGGMLGGQDGGSLQGSSAYQCHLCHMPFVSWALLAQHQSQCPRRGPHRCEQCGKAFRSKTSLTDHINTIHRRMLFICKGCHETFKWRTHIYQHKRKCTALQNATFESGSFFIEEMQQPPQAPLPPPPDATTPPLPVLEATESSMEEAVEPVT